MSLLICVLKQLFAMFVVQPWTVACALSQPHWPFLGLSSVSDRINVVCIEDSGRISYGCQDVIPDEISLRTSAPVSVSLGISPLNCGFCHD